MKENNVRIGGRLIVENNIGRNIYLSGGKKLTLSAPLTDGASIGISTEKDDWDIQLTRDYGAHNGSADPSLYFFSDTGLGIHLKNEEACTGVLRPEGTPFVDFKDQIQTDLSRLSGTNWMSGISGERYLNEINLPSTHDSAMKKVSARGTWGGEVGKLWAKCQYRYIDEQLEDGIRRLDLRLNNSLIRETQVA